MKAQVVVVGGGPVGMLVAAELAAYGVDTVVLEARARVCERPKANTLHARAVQCLVRRGHLPRQVAASDGVGAFHFAGLPGLVISAPVTEPEPILKYPQAELERRFEERAKAAGARVLREHRVTDVVQGEEGVRVTAEGPRGPVVCDARYLVGADGARSAVRELAGIGSDTHQATVSALMGEVTLTDPQALTDGWHRTPRGWVVAKRGSERRMYVRTLNCAGAHDDRKRPPTQEELRQEVSWIAGREIGMEGARWLGRFSDFARLAHTFRERRVFLVGDAAHVHFPIGGQGLSTGVLDALNLGWKLALAARGAAGAALLDTYDLERRPAARQVIDNTRAQLALMRPGSEMDSLRDVFTSMLAADRDHGRLSGMISAQDTVFPGHTGRPSAAAGTFLHNVPLRVRGRDTDVVGLLRDGRPLLLLMGTRAGRHRAGARGWERALHVVRAAASPDIPHEALLVRPDGYVAWAPGGDDMAAALSVYFARDAWTAERRAAADQPDSASCASAALRASA
ncbi:FAD-dependent monooxygenase [Streptomyces sp. NPDC087917]|uniref:FAD-dependent monooxygenase n=1 Tax=Streptomyces sp. NPDC087917 TaxID=3155060 RepID=UPI00341DD7C1